MSPNDFYASAVATLVVILFAKFAAHRNRLATHSTTKSEGRGRLNSLAKFTQDEGHLICVACASLGLLGSLVVLGWPHLKADDIPSWVPITVLVLTLLAALILAIDIAIPPEHE
jgi:hypothetical protein